TAFRVFLLLSAEKPRHYGTPISPCASDLSNSSPADLFYVGNEPKDVEGARRAGCRPVFLAREGESGPDGERRITTLAEIRGWLDGAWPCC
ncbi:MAG: hypothetical protein RDU89_10005, partial [bacterium]|nr:hypothetical protein [bacterium]